MVNFLSNMEAYKLVDEYYIVTTQGALITIRVVQTIVGVQDFSFKAFPYFHLLDKPTAPPFQGIGATADDALQACLKVIDGVSLIDLLASASGQQKHAQRPSA